MSLDPRRLRAALRLLLENPPGQIVERRDPVPEEAVVDDLEVWEVVEIEAAEVALEQRFGVSAVRDFGGLVGKIFNADDISPRDAMNLANGRQQIVRMDVNEHTCSEGKVHRAVGERNLGREGVDHLVLVDDLVRDQTRTRFLVGLERVEGR